ncbi:MAG TPA: hypothetical protein VK071_10380 [Tissierellales bacterium]|nr:hypothetical protein [Tissierellales bacterium]
MISDRAREARKEYSRKYYKENREKILKYQKRWRKENPEKVKEYNDKYWENKARELENK